ncbi:MAG TPA: M4 family metallopeptidase, partial [Polyangiaceae bacterium]|nr:M4 family metallopeptidase [Polyangiaceae bacterium]
AGNGLSTFAMHAGEASPKHKAVFRELAPKRSTARSRTLAAAPVATTALDAEAAARSYLDQALASEHTKTFVRPTMKAMSDPKRAVESDFKSLGAEAQPLTGTTAVKFRQTFQKIPVYGSLVTVELDEKNQLLGINSSLGTPSKVPSVAKIAPADALAKAAKTSGLPVKRLTSTPLLYYYFFRDDSSWRLAYIIEDVPQAKRKKVEARGTDSPRKDYVIDATSGKLLAALPRTPTASVAARATDGLGTRRDMKVERVNENLAVMRNTALNVSTFDFQFRDPSRQENLLPGHLVGDPPDPWPPEAVGAHANAEVVAGFLRSVLKRNNIDNKGGEMRSSVNCWDKSEGTRPARQWKNAFWNGKQMVYGQVRNPDGSFLSIANMTDVVGHEMFHGVTDKTSRLEYEAQSGALNESYSDIFGIIIANFSRPISRWVWKLGEGFDGPGTALRDLQDPTRHGQPKRMADFEPSSPPYTFERNDYGFVHDNSGIHNFAAYKIMTAKAGERYLFTGRQLAQMFYIALTVHLSRTSEFADSRRAVLQAARSLFRKETPASLAKRIRAIESGFSAAGIV